MRQRAYWVHRSGNEAERHRERDMARQTEEYRNTEAGEALTGHGFEPRMSGGIVTFMGRSNGVNMDILCGETGVAPRSLLDPVQVHIYLRGEEDAWVLHFARLTDFLATLK